MPFGKWSSFQECVDEMQKKGAQSPEGLCAYIHHNLTGQWPAQSKKELNSLSLTLSDIALADAVIAEAMALKKYVDKPWNGDKARYTLEQLYNAVPDAVAAWALSNADGKKEDIVKSDLKLNYKEPNGDINLAGVRAALAAIGGARGNPPDLPADVLAKAKAQLEKILESGNKALGNKSLDFKCLEGGIQGTSEDISLSAQIVHKDTAKRLVIGAVLYPGIPDGDQDVVTPERVEKVAHAYMEHYRGVDTMHSLKKSGVPVESWIERSTKSFAIGDMTYTYPPMTWFMASRVDNDKDWQDVLDGKLTGFSICAVPKSMLAQMAEKSLEELTATKRVTLRDLEAIDPEGEWLVPFVSLVDKPSFHISKFLVVKRADGYMAGSFQHISYLLKDALESLIENSMQNSLGIELTSQDWSLQIIYTLPESVVFSVYSYATGEDSGTYQIGYSYDPQNKTVTLNGDPQPVDLETITAPVETPAQVSEKSKPSAWKEILSKLSKAFAPSAIAQKASRTISNATLDKIERAHDSMATAMAHITDLKNTARLERVKGANQKSQSKFVNKSTQEEVLDTMTKDEVVAIVQEQIKPISETLTAVSKSIEEIKTANHVNVDIAKKAEEKTDEEIQAAVKKLTEDMQVLLNDLKERKTASKRLEGQDGHYVEKKGDEDGFILKGRNQYGVRIKEEHKQSNSREKI